MKPPPSPTLPPAPLPPVPPVPLLLVVPLLLCPVGWPVVDPQPAPSAEAPRKAEASEAVRGLHAFMFDGSARDRNRGVPLRALDSPVTRGRRFV
jgi:hypothetical protein